MPPALAFLSRSFFAARAGGKSRWALRFGWGLLVLLHFAAFAMLAWSEVDLAARVAFNTPRMGAQTTRHDTRKGRAS